MRTIDSLDYAENCVISIICKRINANKNDADKLNREFDGDGHTDEASYETPLRIKAKFQATKYGIIVGDIEVDEYLNGAVWGIENFIYQYEY
jgi:hypothetical protein